ncbi:hypothetical protein NL676_039547 [Syzygium grande]|nr:hypothetical protein NL676_039547 [Syzygium grande]
MPIPSTNAHRLSSPAVTIALSRSLPPPAPVQHHKTLKFPDANSTSRPGGASPGDAWCLNFSGSSHRTHRVSRRIRPPKARLDAGSRTEMQRRGLRLKPLQGDATIGPSEREEKLARYYTQESYDGGHTTGHHGGRGVAG